MASIGIHNVKSVTPEYSLLEVSDGRLVNMVTITVTDEDGYNFRFDLYMSPNADIAALAQMGAQS